MCSGVTDGPSQQRDLQSRAVAERLRRLPRDTLPPYAWVEFQRRGRERDEGAQVMGRRVSRITRPLRFSGARGAALAAGCVLAIALVALWSRANLQEWSKLMVSRSRPDSAHAPPDFTRPAPATSLQAEAAAQWVARERQEPAIVRVDTQFALADLEDRIAWVDDLLSVAQVESVQPAHIVALKRERAQLIDSLAQVRYAETLASDLP